MIGGKIDLCGKEIFKKAIIERIETWTIKELNILNGYIQFWTDEEKDGDLTIISAPALEVGTNEECEELLDELVVEGLFKRFKDWNRWPTEYYWSGNGSVD